MSCFLSQQRCLRCCCDTARVLGLARYRKAQTCGAMQEATPPPAPRAPQPAPPRHALTECERMALLRVDERLEGRAQGGRSRCGPRKRGGSAALCRMLCSCGRAACTPCYAHALAQRCGLLTPVPHLGLCPAWDAVLDADRGFPRSKRPDQTPDQVPTLFTNTMTTLVDTFMNQAMISPSCFCLGVSMAAGRAVALGPRPAERGAQRPSHRPVHGLQGFLKLLESALAPLQGENTARALLQGNDRLRRLEREAPGLSERRRMLQKRQGTAQSAGC